MPQNLGPHLPFQGTQKEKKMLRPTSGDQGPASDWTTFFLSAAFSFSFDLLPCLPTCHAHLC
jgi:hypothetical protein